MPSYILSEPYKQRVDRALSVVEGVPSQGGVTTIPTRFETLQQPGQSNPLRLAAYPRAIEWKKGETVAVTLYTQAGTAYGPAITTLPDGSQIPTTASVTNVANDFGIPNPYGVTEDIGPTPTMTWCIVGKPARGDQLVAIEGPVDPVRLATISDGEMGASWPRNTPKTVQITATGQTVEVYSVLDAHTNLDFQNGLVYTKSADPTDPTRTANVVISPPAVPLHEARFSEGNTEEEWNRGDTKQLVVTRADGSDVTVDVENKFFDTFWPGTQPLAIGRFGTAFSLVTGPQPDVALANRQGEGEWQFGSEQQVQVHGETRTISAINLAGHYESFDAKGQEEGPNLLAVRGRGLGASGGTQWYIVAPPPLQFDTGTFDGEWANGADKTFYLDSVGESVQAKNTLFDIPTGAKGAVAKVNDQWKLVGVELETFTGTLVESVQELPYASSTYTATVVTDVEVSGEIKQSAASPVTISVTPVYANYMVVTGVDVTATLTQSAANPVAIGSTVQYTSVTVMQDMAITATLDTASCDIVVTKEPVTQSVAVAAGVIVDAELDPSKLSVNVFANPTYSNLNVLNQVAVNAAFDVTKLYVELATTETTSQITAVGGTAMGKFVEATQTATFLRFPSEAL